MTTKLNTEKPLFTVSSRFFVLVTTVLVVVLSILNGCSGTAGQSTSGRESEARSYSHKVRVTLDVTTVNDMMSQMPSSMTPKISSTPAGYREWAWKFSDGSQMVFSFKPAGGQGSGQGLLLDHVQLKD